MTSLTEPHIKIYRDSGRIVKCEVVSAAGDPVIDLPITGFSIEAAAQSLGAVSIRVHGSRVRFIDRTLPS